MADGHGGYRKPANPAPVSGPGRYARRTDGGPAQVMSAAPNQPYGEASQQLNAQRLAPMAGKEQLPKAAIPSGGDAPQPAMMPEFSGLGFDAPSTRPGEPVTHGVDIGAGGGSSTLNLPTPTQGTGRMTALLQRYSNADPTGGLVAQLMLKAQARNA